MLDPFWTSLLLKMAATSATVVMASWTAERAGPLLGSMVATLPVSAGPIYIFLAMEHDAAFIADSATASLANNNGACLLALVYAAMAQRAPQAVAMGAALATWLAAAVVVTWLEPSFVEAVAASLVLVPLTVVAARHFTAADMPAVVVRRWWDVPLRAVLCALLVGVVVTVSGAVGAAATGIAAVFPVVLTSIMLVLHPRLGGRVTGAILANGVLGLAGFACSLAALHLVAVPVGSSAALVAMFAVAIGWNGVLAWRSRRRRAQSAT